MPEHERHNKDDLPIIAFPDDAEWERWLDENHASASGVWIKTAKKKTGIPTVVHAEALETAICFGWIDGQRHPYDETYYLQRFTPRKPRSRWSQVNVKKAQALIAAKRMRPAGHAQIEAAKADGRWDAAYEPQSRASVPEDFQRALDRNPTAKEFFETLTGVNRYAFLYRIQSVKRPETRQRKIEQFVAMLAEHRTLHP
jgi:uncharacterized protein YdeI (YjbR/CyaY-like superfamily)